MARIRSIKPEFWTDGQIKRLSDSTALFFIALWNHCDDYGYFTLDPLELSMKTARWRSQDMMKMCRALHGRGLIKASTVDGVGMIEGWSHQKISDRRASKWNDKPIAWDDHFSDAPESGKIRLGEDRIGEDRIGKDHTPKVGKRAARAPKPLASVPVGKILSAVYIDAYRERYHDDPILRPQDFKLLKTIAQSLGLEKASELVRAFMRMNTAWFITRHHDVPTFNGNLNAVQLFLNNGTLVTSADARNLEAASSFNNQLQRLGVVER